MTEASPSLALGMSLLAGLSTTLGAGIVFLVPGQRISPGQMAFSLALAAGVMISVTVLEFWLPMLLGGREARPVIVCSLAGAAAFWLLSHFVPEAHPMPESAEVEGVKPGRQRRDMPSEETPVVYGSADSDVEKLSDPDTPHASAADDMSKRRSLRLAVVMMLSLTAHNFPEGFAVAVSASQSSKLGLVVMCAIAVHNVPEGIAIAVPVLAATGSKMQALWMSFLSGMAEPVGALTALLALHYFGGSLNEASTDYLLCVVGGVMFAVAVMELLPEACKQGSLIVVSTGVALGFLIMWVTIRLGA